jgi:hypothetical protein
MDEVVSPSRTARAHDAYRVLFEACRKFAVVHGLIRKHAKLNTGLLQRQVVSQVTEIVEERNLSDRLSKAVRDAHAVYCETLRSL